MPKAFTTPLRESRAYKAFAYGFGLVQFSLYGVKSGKGLRASRVTILNRGEISLGEGVSLLSYPDGSSYVCGLRTYFPAARIDIGSYSLLNGAMLHSSCSITLGKQVMLGPGVTIVDNDSHPPVRSEERYTCRPPEAPVHLMDRVWVGMHSTIMKGVTVGENTIIAAGSVVTRNLPANVLAAGAPARPLRTLPADLQELTGMRTKMS